MQAKEYKRHYGTYPAVVQADKIYLSLANRLLNYFPSPIFHFETMSSLPGDMICVISILD